MNRRSFMWLVGCVAGSFGLTKAFGKPEQLATKNINNLPVAKFNKRGVCTNTEELFGNIPYKTDIIHWLGERNCLVWIREDDAMTYTTTDKVFRYWGEATVSETKTTFSAPKVVRKTGRFHPTSNSIEKAAAPFDYYHDQIELDEKNVH